MSNTHFVVPGLFGPFPEWELEPDQFSDQEEKPEQRYPNIEKILARADIENGVFGYTETLFQLFSIPFKESAQDQATAPLIFRADSGLIPEGFVMQADPVFLKPDQDRLLLFDTPSQDLTAEEAAAYIAAFNSHFRSDGLSLFAPNAARWYLHWAKAPDVQTRPLSDALGRNMDMFLPEGQDSVYLTQVINETQMLFHALGVSDERQREGKLPVSGLWFSGGGMLCARGQHHFADIQCDDLLCKGLLESSDETQAEDRLIVEKSLWRAVLDADMEAWSVALGKLDERLAEELNSNETFYLYSCDGSVYRWQSAMARRFWRRKRSVASYVQPEM